MTEQGPVKETRFLVRFTFSFRLEFRVVNPCHITIKLMISVSVIEMLVKCRENLVMNSVSSHSLTDSC